MTLEAQSLTVRYPDQAQPAVDDVSLSLQPGELIAIAGANGCGKSTLCRTLAGAVSPDAGAVLVDGTRLRAPRPTTIQFVQQSIEDHIVAPVVRDDVAFGPECLGLPDAEVAARVAAALATVGLEGFEEREVATLSGGELARLALAGALAMQPRYLLLDEPTAHLDPRSADDLVALVRGTADEGAGVLFVSHRLEETRHADRLILMASGRIVADGTPRELLYRPGLLETVGLARPPVITLVERWRADGPHVEGAPLSIDEFLAATGAEAWPASI